MLVFLDDGENRLSRGGGQIWRIKGDRERNGRENEARRIEKSDDALLSRARESLLRRFMYSDAYSSNK